MNRQKGYLGLCVQYSWSLLDSNAYAQLMERDGAVYILTECNVKKQGSVLYREGLLYASEL